VDGCFRKYATIPATHAIPIPNEVPLEEAAREFVFERLQIFSYFLTVFSFHSSVVRWSDGLQSH
jgi:hypothetical protein